MKPLVVEDGKIEFLYEVHNNYDYGEGFIVYRATEWGADNIVTDKEVYAQGWCKFDGCIDIKFGDNEGDLHMCDVFDSHIKFMNALNEYLKDNVVVSNHD